MSLAGRGVVVTRPRELAEFLAARIRAAGGRPLVFPAIEIEPLPAPAALGRLDAFDLVVFVSPTAVAMAAGPLHRVRLAAVGAGTRQALERRGAQDVLAPAAGGDSEALLALPALAAVRGRRVLIVRGEGGRALLGDTLASRGAHVEYAECYRRRLPAADPSALHAQWANGGVHAVTFFSAEGVDNFVKLVGAAHVRETPAFVSHERIARAAAQHGMRQTIVAGPGDAEMVDRLVAYFRP